MINVVNIHVPCELNIHIIKDFGLLSQEHRQTYIRTFYTRLNASYKYRSGVDRSCYCIGYLLIKHSCSIISVPYY